MKTQTEASIETFDVMEFLKKYLEKSSRLRTMYRDYQEFQNIKTRAESLSKALKDNERGCSCEELDTVAEVITGNPSHQSTIAKAQELAESAKQAYVPHVRAMLREYRTVLADAKSYFQMLIPSSKTTTLNEIKITNFVNQYPLLNFFKYEDGRIECGCIIKDGIKNVNASFEEYDKVLRDFCYCIDETFGKIDKVLGFEDESFMDVHSRVVQFIPCMEDACVQMDLLGHSFYVFINAETDQVNVVYRRKKGDYGLIEPEY